MAARSRKSDKGKATKKTTKPRTRRARKPRTIELTVDLAHLAAPEGVSAPTTFGDLVPPPGEEPTQQFRLLRPLDLVVLDVLGFGLELRKDADGHALVPVGEEPRLEVRYPFQHVGEQAFFREAQAVPVTTIPPDDVPEIDEPPRTEGPFAADPITRPPVLARAAYGSALVFDVPVGERIEFSVEGVLAAISRLPLRVVPLATPRPLGKRPPVQGGVIVLPGGFSLSRTSAGLVLQRVGRTPGRGRKAVPASPVDGLITASNALRTARRFMTTEGTLDLVTDTTGPGIRVHGGLGDLLPPPIIQKPPPRQRPRKPRSDETAIEAPYRLIISPSVLGGFAHTLAPESAPTDPDRVEFWHSRLGVRREDEKGVVTVDERADPQRIVRAVWARDKEGVEPPDPLAPPEPFRMSLVGLDRVMLVRQSADPQITVPQPVSAERLALSSLGAWLDLQGRWDILPYAQAGEESILAWDHIAPMGRDQFVRVVYPGYLFPFGHRCALVKITERKIIADINVDPAQPQARLYQRKFLIISEPVRSYTDDQSRPFTQVAVRPLATPDLDDPQPADPTQTIDAEFLFWPTVAGAKFEFVLDCFDHDGRRVLLQAPLLFVAAHLGSDDEKTEIVDAYKPGSKIPADGQSVAFAPSTRPGDTAYESVVLQFTGDPGDPGELSSDPHLKAADVVVPAMRHLAPAAPQVTVFYAEPYTDDGFGGANAAPQVLLELAVETEISFGSTDSSGGFIQPNLPVRGLSRLLGTVGDIDSLVNPADPALPFDPTKFLDGVLPKLFGLFNLVDILAAAGLDKAPAFLTEQLDAIAALLSDLDELRTAVADGVIRTAEDAASAATDTLRAQAEAARARLDAVRASLDDLVDDLVAAIDALLALDTPSDIPAVTAAVGDLLDDLRDLVDEILAIVAELPLPPLVKAELERLAGATAPLLAASKIVDTIEAIAAFVNGFDPSAGAVRARFDWRPTLTNFPATATSQDDALFFVDPQGFTLSIEARASGTEGVGVDVLAELRDFGLNLFPGEPLIRLNFDRMAFRAPSGRKPEVDVVFNGIEWLGVLGFISTLQELIPFDGFSDPPFVDVSTEGVTAGFDLALPNVAVGVFSLENISLGADVNVPFLGDAVTAGFAFCTREKPFRLTVMMIGGGGFVGIRLSPKGLVVLEMALEAGASVSINLGVASGSVSVMIGIYLRLEADAGSLTGYFRIRGEVEVLGLITASITLELSLTYEFETGKMVGRASVTVEVEVLFFSTSVEISCERRLAGSSGDPTFAEVLGIAPDGTVPDPGAPDGGVPAWSQYVAAFGPA
jgi:hypothetical protein